MIRVLVVDDSPTARRHLERVLSADPSIQVVGSAPDPFAARDLIVQLKPDLVTLDIEMPRMDGLTFLRRLMHYYPLPVVVLSSLTARGGEKALEAVRAGAVAVISKPMPEYPREQMEQDLLAAVRSSARARLARRLSPGPAAPKQRVHVPATRVLAIGASAGGTSAIEQVLESLPADGPATLIVQHMPAAFTASFAARLDRLSAMEVREARDGDRVERGLVLLAPGGRHLLLRRSEQGLAVQVKDGPPVNGHRPSVDVLFRSVASVLHGNAVAALLTGMGSDGAYGLLQLREAGALTIAQDEATSAIFGMPKAAIDLGAAQRVLPLESIAAAALSGIGGA